MSVSEGSSGVGAGPAPARPAGAASIERAPVQTVTGSGPAGAAFAGRFARELLAELIPPAVRPWLIAGAVALVGLVVVLLVRSCG
jgi:hypothetical protein